MTVAQLINKLKEMPQDAEICLQIFNNYYCEGTKHMSSHENADFDIFETEDDEVCIQAMD